MDEEEKKLWAQQAIERDELAKRQARRLWSAQEEAIKNINNAMSDEAKLAHRYNYQQAEKAYLKKDAEEREALQKKQLNDLQYQSEKGTEKTTERQFIPPKDDGRLLAEEPAVEKKKSIREQRQAAEERHEAERKERIAKIMANAQKQPQPSPELTRWEKAQLYLAQQENNQEITHKI